jgi:hypothetical protein
MKPAGELRRALDGRCATGPPEVRGNGESLAGLEGVPEVSAEADAAFLHLWSAQLEFAAGSVPRETRPVEREQFSSRLRRILTDHFPDETVEPLAPSADLHHTISGSYPQGMVRRGSGA